MMQLAFERFTTNADGFCAAIDAISRALTRETSSRTEKSFKNNPKS
jgi:hypothetical protein